MAYYLKLDASGMLSTRSQITIPATDSYTITIECFLNSNTASNINAIIGDDGNNVVYYRVDVNRWNWNCNGTAINLFPTFASFDEWLTIRLIKVGDDRTIEISRGVETESSTFTTLNASFEWDTVGARGTAGAWEAEGGIRRLECDHPTYDFNFDFDQSTGIIVPNMGSGEDLTIQNAPGDDSQWVLYGSGAQILAPSSITSEEAFGSPSVTNLLSQIFPSSIASEEAFGQPVITGLVAVIVPIGIPSEEAFGDSNVKLLLSYINPTGIPSEEQFGVAEVSLQTQIISPEGILSQETFGQPLVFDGEYAVIPVGNRRTLRQVAEYLRTQGYSGSVDDVVYTWLAHQSYDGNPNDKLFEYLKDQGFLNSLQDKRKEWENA